MKPKIRRTNSATGIMYKPMAAVDPLEEEKS
jgi:hypothetical protein